MNVTTVVPGVHRIDLGFVNAYLCEDVDGLTLIDCGLSTSAVTRLRSVAQRLEIET